jgi:hypothetical protein
MKFLTLIINLVFLSFYSYGQVYQLPNGGFELWNGNGSDDEPKHWNGFPSAKCDINIGCNLATSTRHAKSTDTRPGSTGEYSCKIFATEINILGKSITANGTLSTGRIRVGSSNTSSFENYNFTLTSNPRFNQPLHAMPDSIRFWAKFVCSDSKQEARMNAVVHDNYDYRDPQVSDVNAKDHVVGRATLNFPNNNNEWKLYSIPFNYNDTYYPATSPAYILLTFTTNKEPGGGSKNDALYIDDVELIYNTYLKKISVNGNNLANFNPELSEYYINADCNKIPEFAFETMSPNANAKLIKSTENDNLYTISVSNANQLKEYKIYVYSFEYASDEICQGETYNKNGFELPAQNTAGIFTFRREIDDNECKKMLELSLSVNQAYHIADTFKIMIHEDYEYDFFGDLINSTGIYKNYISSSKGCDSLVVLDLIVGDHFEYTINASICEGDIYNKNGFYENKTGFYSITLPSSYLCDSIVNLNLSVNSYYEEIFDAVYKDEFYFKNGFAIINTEEIGDIRDSLILKTTLGCDSIIVLNLNIKDRYIEYPPTNSDFQFIIFPNPVVNDYFTIKIEDYFAGDLYYAIYTMQGLLVRSGNIPENNFKISAKGLNIGIYIVKLYLSTEFCKSTKIIIAF